MVAANGPVLRQNDQEMVPEYQKKEKIPAWLKAVLNDPHRDPLLTRLT